MCFSSHRFIYSEHLVRVAGLSWNGPAWGVKGLFRAELVAALTKPPIFRDVKSEKDGKQTQTAASQQATSLTCCVEGRARFFRVFACEVCRTISPFSISLVKVSFSLFRNFQEEMYWRSCIQAPMHINNWQLFHISAPPVRPFKPEQWHSFLKNVNILLFN